MGVLNNWQKVPFVFGGASLSGVGGGYGFGKLEENSSEDLLNYAFDRGITIYDTAPIYGYGVSEQVLGQHFKSRREKVFYISKSGVDWHTNLRVNMTNDPKVTLKMLEQSLKSLDSEYIDLYMIHWPDKNTDIRRPMDVLAKAKERGKINHIGLCNTNQTDLDLASEVEVIEVVQSEYNLFNQTSFCDLNLESRELLTWGTFDKGILANTVDFNRIYPKEDCRSFAPWWKKSNKNQKIKFCQKKLFPLLKEFDLTPIDFSLNFSLLNKKISRLLIGAKSIEQFETCFSALDKRIEPDLIKQVDELLKNGLDCD